MAKALGPDYDVAKNIHRQIGSMALMMLGAKKLTAHKDGLAFAIRGCRKVNRVMIKLNGRDLYDIEYFKCGPKIGINSVAKDTDIYCDMIHASIESNTGLATHL